LNRPSEAEERERVSIAAAFKEMPRSHQAVVLILSGYILATFFIYLDAWIRHEPPMSIWWVVIAMLSMLAVCIWHAVVVKGAKPAAAFFAICILTGWFLEFIGHNYGWYFGHYNYTGTLGPRIGGVPVLITITWAFIVYSSMMIIDWLVGMKGGTRARTWWGKTLWSTLVAAATATLVCAWDLLVDPMATSGVWWTAAGKDPWWFWFYGGPYLRELPGKEGMGMPGVPIGNFVGWWLAAFFMAFVFLLFFNRGNRISGTLLDIVPLQVYIYIFLIVAFITLQMNWYFDGMNQISMIGFFVMMPVILVSAVKLAWDYT